MQDSVNPDGRHRLFSMLEPIIYGDVFDYPLTIEEIRTYCTRPVALEELRRDIENDADFNRLVSRRGEFFYLNGQRSLGDVRDRRKETSRKAWRTARKVVRFIKYIPFVKGIMATGSLAVNNVRQEDDLDFLVLISANRIWFAFFVLGTLQRILSRRYLCPNYYISLDHIRLSRRTFYVAREAAQARAMYGVRQCRRFFEENDWIFEIFPNLESPDILTNRGNAVAERSGPLKAASGAVEWLLSGRIGNGLEKILKKLLHHRLAAHYGLYEKQVPDEVLQNALNEVELRFHGLSHEEKIESEIRAKSQRLAECLKNGQTLSDSGDFDDPRPNATA